ncbi:hypothetical protein [Methylocapsa aurea]|nr:hypothetical protein [Methylocapsa aurea]
MKFGPFPVAQSGGAAVAVAAESPFRVAPFCPPRAGVVSTLPRSDG